MGKTRKTVLKCNTKQNLYVNAEIEYMGRISTDFYIKMLCFNNLSECSEGVNSHSDKLDIICGMNLDFQKAFDFESCSLKTL